MKIGTFLAFTVILSLGLGCGLMTADIATDGRQTDGTIPTQTKPPVTDGGKTQSETGSLGKEVFCNESRDQERLLCDLTAPEWEMHETDYNPFKITYNEVDLNDDGIEELIIWESSWAGTSGGQLVVLKSQDSDIERIFVSDWGGWTPILVLTSKQNGWKDIAFLQAGGGVKATFLILKFEKNGYSVAATSETQPEGRVVIGKSWKKSTFGPIIE
ncbi:MAG: hypothetical protein KF855_11245 [Acidobacteria bacterium]|nr:hypothetical protein [Acidobacteriota bacterium]